MEPYKYTSTFASALKCSVSEEKDLLLAKASLDELRKSIPNLTNDNQAFMNVVFPAFVVNRVNKNDDVIDTKTALAIYQKFIHNPTNIEHKRHNVVGVIVSAGFTEFGTDKPLTYDEVKDLTTPFCVTLGAIVWKVINPEFASMLEDSNDPTSDDFMSISASWELGFQDYKIVELAKNQKNIATARIISNAEEVEKLSKQLKINGGTGIIEDRRIYRMPCDDVFPLGIGFTQKPAADVKGVAVAKAETVNDTESKAELSGIPTYDFYFCPTCNKEEPKFQSLKINEFGHVACPSCKTTSPTTQWSKMKAKDSKSTVSAPENKISDINEKNICNSSNSGVNIERNNINNFMFKNLKDITDEAIKTAVASNIAIASPIAELVSSELKKGNDTWLTEKSSLENHNKEVEQKLAAASAKQDETQKALDELKNTVASLQKEKADREAVEQFNNRMSVVAEQYEFDEEQQTVIASEIKAIKSDEEFTTWESKAKKMFKPFQKGKKNDKDKDDDKKDDDKNKDAKANVQVQESAASVVDNAVDNGKKDGAVVNSSTAEAPSLAEKYKSAFAMENFIITKR